jgi:amino acid transporter
MLMASRLLYGMARQEVLPPFLGRVHPTRRTPYMSIIFTTAIAFGLIILVTKRAGGEVIGALGGTTALLLLGVFTIVNICVLVLRKDVINRPHFVAPTVLPIIGALVCAFFVTPWTGRDTIQYTIAGWLLALGVVLWVITWFANRALRAKRTYIRHPEEIGEREGGVN